MGPVNMKGKEMYVNGLGASHRKSVEWKLRSFSRCPRFLVHKWTPPSDLSWMAFPRRRHPVVIKLVTESSVLSL